MAAANENTPLLRSGSSSLLPNLSFRSLPSLEASHPSSLLSKEDVEEILGDTAVGEILPYNPYSSIDFLHDLVSLPTPA